MIGSQQSVGQGSIANGAHPSTTLSQQEQQLAAQYGRARGMKTFNEQEFAGYQRGLN